MKIVAHNRVLEIEGKDGILSGLDQTNVNHLVEAFFASAARAQDINDLDIRDMNASADVEREITGDEIVAFVRAAGGKVEYTIDAESGLVETVTASSGRPIVFEYEPDEAAEVLESLLASALPSKVVGDLAQTSYTATSSFTGNTTSGSPNVAAPSSVAGLAAGQAISGAGIPNNATIAAVAAAVNLSPTGNTTSGSPTVTGLSSTDGIVVGQAVAGVGVPSSTTVAAVGAGQITLSANATATASGVVLTITSPASVTLSANATATASGVTLTATGQTQILGLGEWTLDWKRKTVDSTTTDDADYESSLGSTASWSVKAKYMFLIGDTTQSAAILAAIQSPQSALPWNFFPDVNVGHPAFSGYAYVDGITIASGTGKLVSLDTSLKGTGKLLIGSQAAPVSQPLTGTGLQAKV